MLLFFFFQDDSGYVDFREYLIGLALVSQPANSEEAMQLAFQVRLKEPRKQFFRVNSLLRICVSSKDIVALIVTVR